MNARHPDAPTPEQTAERILQRIARATSKAPARADEVRCDLGLSPATFAAGLDHLQRHRQVATAEIQRAGDDALWLAIWPTGVFVEHGSWTGCSHSGLFNKDATPRRFPAAPDPTRDPRPDLRAPAAQRATPQVAPAGHEERVAPAHESARPMARTGSAAGASSQPATSTTPTTPTTPTAKENPMPATQAQPRPRGKLQAAVIDALAGRTRDQAIPGPDLAQQLGVSAENLRHCTRNLAQKGVIGHLERKVGAWQVATYYDIATDTAAPAPATPEPAPAARQPISEDEIQAFVDGLEPEPAWAPQPAVPAEESATVARDATAEQAAAPQIDFALWADGRLDIVDGDELIQIPPCDVARLALLLGVPGAALPQLIGA